MFILCEYIRYIRKLVRCVYINSDSQKIIERKQKAVYEYKENKINPPHIKEWFLLYEKSGKLFQVENFVSHLKVCKYLLNSFYILLFSVKMGVSLKLIFFAYTLFGIKSLHGLSTAQSQGMYLNLQISIYIKQSNP